jgi:hypothetical protein
LAAKVVIKIVQEMLGHSSRAITEAAAALVPFTSTRA